MRQYGSARYGVGNRFIRTAPVYPPKQAKPETPMESLPMPVVDGPTIEKVEQEVETDINTFRPISEEKPIESEDEVPGLDGFKDVMKDAAAAE